MWKQTINRGLLVIVLFSMVGLFALPHRSSAAAGINQQMAFQGKIVLANGTNIPDGTYNIEFKIYDGGTSGGGGTLKWTEDRLIGGTGGVVVTSGTFTVNLGSANAFGASVDWNSDTLWLSLQVGNTSSCTITTTFTADCGGDGEMTPYIRLTAVPYAFNALQLGGVAATGYGQLASNQTWTGINTFSLTGGKAVAITGAPINTATVSLVQLGNAIAGGNVSANGGTYIGINAPGSGAGSAADFLNLQNNSVTQFRVDSSGNATAAGTVQAATINGTSAIQLNGANINTAGTLTNVAYLNQANTFSGTTNTFNATGGNSVAVTGAPTNSATSSLVRIGSAIAGGNTSVNGGTYLGINLPAAGAGSAADIVNFQANGTVALKLASNGALTVGGAITAPTATNTINGLIVNNGALSGITSLSQVFTSATNGASANTLTVTNSNASATATTISGTTITPVGTANGNANANTINGINFANVATLANNSVNGINFGTGYNNGINFTSATGFTNFITTPTIVLSAGGGISGVTSITQSGTASNTLTGSTTVSNNVTVNSGTSNQLVINSGTSVPGVDQVVVDNTGSTGVVTAGVNGQNIKYRGGAAAVEAAGMRVDFIPGTTSGGTWSGMRIVADATGAVAGVTAYGIKLEGPTTPGAGSEKAVFVGSGWDIGLDIQSGGMQLAAQADPGAPAASNLRIYANDIAGKTFLKSLGNTGADTPFQSHLGFNRTSMMMPAGGATLTTFVGGYGTAFTNVGTAANPALASTNILTSTRRATFSTGAVAGALTSHRQNTLQVWRGNAAGLGGFFYTIRFGTSALAAGNRMFVGLSDSIAAPTNVDPTTNTTPGKIGMAINANTGNWNIVTNVTGAVPTVTPLGASFPVATNTMYELVLYSAPNGSGVGYRVKNLGSGAVTSGTISANLPANTTFLSPNFWATNNATGAAAIIDFAGWYLESDN